MIRLIKNLFRWWGVPAITTDKPSPNAEPLVVLGPGGEYTTTYYGVEHAVEKQQH